MASRRQIEANRKNAKLSTGPRTKLGKARSSRNACRHGLARSAPNDDVEIERLASAILAGLRDQPNSSAAMDLARARLRLSQIRNVRHAMLAALLGCPSSKDMTRLAGLERYERAARAVHKRLFRCLLHSSL
jgi:hypothetical protein